MTGFTLPTSRPVTQAWGAEFDDWDGDGVTDYPGGFYHSIGWNGHNGIDYGCHEGDPVEAVADGVAVWAGWAGNHWLLSGGGIAVLIEHRAYGVQTEYLHLSETALNPGDRVSMGQVIGRSGSTGSSTAPHLHLGMLPLSGIDLNNRMRGRIDPTPYLYGGIAAMGATITPIQEDDDMASVPQAEWDEMKRQMKSVVDNVVTDKKLADALATLPLGVWSYQNPELGGGDAFQILRDALASTNRLTDTVSSAAAKAAASGADEAAIKGAVKDAITELLIKGATK